MSNVYPKLTPLADQLELMAQQVGVQPNALVKIRQGQPPTTTRLLIYGVPNEAERHWLDQYIGQEVPSVWGGQNTETALSLPTKDVVEIIWWEMFSPKHEPTVHALAFLAEAAKDFLTDAESHIAMAAMGAPALSVVYGDPSVKPSVRAVDAFSRHAPV